MGNLIANAVSSTIDHNLSSWHSALGARDVYCSRTIQCRGMRYVARHSIIKR